MCNQPTALIPVGSGVVGDRETELGRAIYRSSGVAAADRLTDLFPSIAPFCVLPLPASSIPEVFAFPESVHLSPAAEKEQAEKERLEREERASNAKALRERRGAIRETLFPIS